jgi:hypothetical protein
LLFLGCSWSLLYRCRSLPAFVVSFTGKSDDIKTTINYVDIFQIIKKVLVPVLLLKPFPLLCSFAFFLFFCLFLTAYGRRQRWSVGKGCR